MNILQNLMERLRPLVGFKGWDYCVFWKLSEDQRFIEWMDCCCAGTEINTENGGDDQELLFPVSPSLPCRDVLLQHPRTKSCDLIAHLPSSIPLDSGIHAQTLISNQPRWLIFSNSSDSNAMEVSSTKLLGQETECTRVLIPAPGGLIELFISKQVCENQNVIDFITDQYKHILLEQEVMINNVMMNDIILAEGSHEPMNQFKSEAELEALQNPIMINAENMQMQFMEFKGNKEIGRSESISDCSDQIDDDEDDNKGRRRNAKGQPQSKNLVAERKRRKKLNDRLYALRGLVPKISKLDKASILGDAIEFVKELQKEAKELQDELEELSDDDEGTHVNYHKNAHSEILNHNIGAHLDYDKAPNGFHHMEASANDPSKQEHDFEISNDKAQQMEVQVEVAQIDGNELFVKVFCEHKPGGLVRLMEALNSLGLEVTNANVTSFRSLVSNVFKVEKRDSALVEAERVRESLLELTRINPSKGWPEIDKDHNWAYK